MPGNYYFASMPACQANQPMKFPIYVVGMLFDIHMSKWICLCALKYKDDLTCL